MEQLLKSHTRTGWHEFQLYFRYSCALFLSWLISLIVSSFADVTVAVLRCLS